VGWEDGYGEGEDGDDELRHVDPESCLGHGATASLAVANAIQKSENTESPAGIKRAAFGIGMRYDTPPLGRLVQRICVFRLHVGLFTIWQNQPMLSHWRWLTYFICLDGLQQKSSKIVF
jgi:hypothetical protein